jgi:hypothetical protein
MLKLKRKLTFRHAQNGHFYVAHVARFFQVISMGVTERRRLHATHSRHTTVSFPDRPQLRAGPTLQALLTEALNDLFSKYGKPPIA